MTLSFRERLAFLPGLVNWGVWLLMVVLTSSQFLGIVWNTSSTVTKTVQGRSPVNPPTSITGFNDEPYTDRSIVCRTQGRSYVPMQLSTVLADSTLSTVIDTQGDSVSGFRVVKREGVKLQPQITDIYTRVCDRIDYTLTAIQDSCDALGFNVTRDSLRVVDDVFSNTTRQIPQALPILIVPSSDDAVQLHYVISGWQGSACIFRLNGLYQTPTIEWGMFRAVPKTVRELKTVEWLKKPDGQWRNGWYEDAEGQRWFSNMMTSKNEGPYGIHVRQFDTLANKELDCDAVYAVSRCKPALILDNWGNQLTTTSEITQEDYVFATNGMRFGFFLFDSTMASTITIFYSLEMFISNASICMILIRWFVSLAAMLHSYWLGDATWQTTGIGCLSSSRTFNALPVVLLPRLKTSLSAFFTVGCSFEGPQLALEKAWYITYPGIVELLLFYYSLLNALAKITFRRMSDALFTPTLLVLCALHYFREELAGAQWLGIPGRVSTLFASEEVTAMKLPDFLTTDAAIRMNGSIAGLFYFKIALMVLNLVPLLVAENMTEKGKKFRAFAACDIERLLALRASNMGGLGRSEVYATLASTVEKRIDVSSVNTKRPVAPSKSDVPFSHTAVEPLHKAFPREDDLKKGDGSTDPDQPKHVLIGYEMSRLGYLVFGEKFVLSFDDWYILTSMAPLRVVEKLWNYRVVVCDVKRTDYGSYRVTGTPYLCRLDDPKLRAIPFYRVTVWRFH